MITYPSTHGVFEEGILEAIKIGELFEVSGKIKNIGNYPLNGVTTTISIPTNLSTTEPLTKIIGDPNIKFI